jgi:hypothetical protein
MPFNDTLSRFNPCCIAVYTGSSYTQLFMSMWKLRKRLILLIEFIFFYIFLILIGHDKYGRTLLQVCSALSDKWSVIDWLLKQKKVDINPKNLESGYTVNILQLYFNKFIYLLSQALHYSVFYGRIDNSINLIKVFYPFFKVISYILFVLGRCKYNYIRL